MVIDQCWHVEDSGGKVTPGKLSLDHFLWKGDVKNEFFSLPETNELPLKMDGWKVYCIFPIGWEAYFQLL